MVRPRMLRVIGAAILYSVFAKKQKENGMPAKIMDSHTDHTPKELRQLALKHKFRDCRRERFAYGVQIRSIGFPIANQAASASFGAEAGNLTGAFALRRRTMARHASSNRPDFNRERNVRTP